MKYPPSNPISAVFIALAATGVSVAHAQSDFTALLTETSTGTFRVEGAERIQHARAKELAEAGVVFIDVRREVQYNREHIPGAVSLELKAKLTEQSLAEVAQKDQEIVFYCSDAQCYRSAHASAMAVSWGYENVRYFGDGWEVWSSMGYPSE